jgi:Cdc6-like AAA superfamily ATPase
VFANVTNFDEVGLEDQSDLLNELQQVVRYNLESWEDTAATSHFILFIGGVRGIGKTRLGKELYLHCSKTLKNSMYVYIRVANDIISGQLPHSVESLLVEMAARYRRKLGHGGNPSRVLRTHWLLWVVCLEQLKFLLQYWCIQMNLFGATEKNYLMQLEMRFQRDMKQAIGSKC